MNLKKITFLSLLVTNFAFSQTPNENSSIDDRFGRCMAESGGVTFDMRECSRKAIRQWDKELNKNYKLLMKTLNLKQQKALRVAQRAWIKFRDSEMDFLYSTQIGVTEEFFINDSRYLSLTKQRAIELKNLLAGYRPKQAHQLCCTRKINNSQSITSFGW